MGRICTICSHPDCVAIDAAIEAGGSFGSVARQFGVSKSALDRHSHTHTVGQRMVLKGIERATKAKARRWWRRRWPWVVFGGIMFLAGVRFASSLRGNY